jgi:glycosyltransferase involved in cell wall biosynthesis
MHVALLTPAWPPGVVANGIVTYVAAVRAELQRQGHRVSVFAPDVHVPGPGVHRVRAGAAERVVAELASRVQRRGGVFAFGRTIATAMARVHERDPIDVIEMEESFGWVGEVAAKLRVPVVCKLHGPAFLTMVAEELATEFGQEKLRREGEALARMPAIIAPSRYTLGETLARYRLEPAIAEHVVNPLELAPDAALWDPHRCDRDTVLFVGRFDKLKGGDLAVLAFRQLLAERPTLRLVFAGPDPGLLRPDGSVVHLREFVAAFDDSALASAIRWTGPLDARQVAELRAAAALTIVPSRRESQGYTALEAMLQACPLVCTDTSGLAEIVVHGVSGLKARPEDPGDLARQMRRILDDVALGQALGRAGREYVLQQHAPAAVVGRNLDVYRRAIALQRSHVAARH